MEIDDQALQPSDDAELLSLTEEAVLVMVLDTTTVLVFVVVPVAGAEDHADQVLSPSTG